MHLPMIVFCRFWACYALSALKVVFNYCPTPLGCLFDGPELSIDLLPAPLYASQNKQHPRILFP